MNSAVFSADGIRVVTASQDKTARVWDVSTIPKGNVRQVACQLLNNNFGLDGVTAYPLTFDRPICATDPPPPDLTAEPTAQAAAKWQHCPRAARTGAREGTLAANWHQRPTVATATIV